MFRVSLLLLLIAARAHSAEDSFPVRDLTIDGIYATRAGDATQYCLLGADACRWKLPRNPWTQDPAIDSWLTTHLNARVTPVSEQKNSVFPKTPAVRRVYIWIEDGTDSLNMALILEGRYAATAMIDMVEAELRTLDITDADLRQQLEQERGQIPEENRPHRLITNSDYAAKMQLVMQAEQDAKRGKKGQWSDAGLRGRSPPKDSYLMDTFAEHSDWFHAFANLIHRVTGEFYGDFLQEKIFKPLDMSSTRIISEADIVPNRSAGYRLLEGKLKNQEWVAPALNTTADGSLYLSILDLVKWDAAYR